ncbi:MAG TPA: DUF4007 family protein [Chitinophagaceae bacterium]|nr:DUF4007 domain-containing protein [Flavobacterium sp.]HRF23652.1 DUF4007 family protein [Chitinophagaceae bacterium]
MKLQFSGHESFICKHLWLKKGYDFKGNFNEESAVIELGVGKNMVTSISYWLKAFGIIDADNKYTDLATYLFHDKKGVDPYIENIATVWLLHYSLNKTNKASIYNLFFNQFRKIRTEFTKEHLQNFIVRLLKDENQKSINENTIAADISVFLRNYLKPTSKETKVDIEEDFSSLMIDLDLISHFSSENVEGKFVDWYRVPSKIQYDLPDEIVLFTILENYPKAKSISFNELIIGNNSPGLVFCLNEEGLYAKIEKLASKYKGVIYTETAGVRELQIKSNIDKWEVLNGCY